MNSDELLTRYKKGKRDFFRTYLPHASFMSAYLRDVNLCGAILYGANLTGANLTDANLTDANLYGANLYGANLAGAILTGAIFSYPIGMSARHDDVAKVYDKDKFFLGGFVGTKQEMIDMLVIEEKGAKLISLLSRMLSFAVNMEQEDIDYINNALQLAIAKSKGGE